MTIHHDKLAYGKLAPTSENLSEERLAQMLAELNGSEDNENNPAEDGASAAPAKNKDHVKHKRKT